MEEDAALIRMVGMVDRARREAGEVADAG